MSMIFFFSPTNKNLARTNFAATSVGVDVNTCAENLLWIARDWCIDGAAADWGWDSLLG